MTLVVLPTSKSTSMHGRSTSVVTPCSPAMMLSCSRFRTFKIPRFSYGVEDSPVVNNSRIE